MGDKSKIEWTDATWNPTVKVRPFAVALLLTACAPVPTAEHIKHQKELIEQFEQMMIKEGRRMGCGDRGIHLTHNFNWVCNQ